MTWLALLRNWKLILGGLAFGAALIWGAIQKEEARHWHKRYTNEAAAHVADNTRWEEAQALANARATSAKLAREAHDEQIRKEAESAYSAQLADARARLADYVRLHTAPRADQGSAGASDLPVAGQAASQPDGPLDASVLVSLDDLNRCTEAVIRLINAQRWARDIQGGEPRD